MSNISKKQAPRLSSGQAPRLSSGQAPRLSSGQVEHIANLARMEISQEEKKKFSKELSSILGYVEKLNEIDTSGVEPISQIAGLENIEREDKARKTQEKTRKRILEQAPGRRGNYFKVPKIFE